MTTVRTEASISFRLVKLETHVLIEDVALEDCSIAAKDTPPPPDILASAAPDWVSAAALVLHAPQVLHMALRLPTPAPLPSTLTLLDAAVDVAKPLTYGFFRSESDEVWMIHGTLVGYAVQPSCRQQGLLTVEIHIDFTSPTSMHETP